jgi:Tfp pilus assembly protein PilF
VKVSQGEGATKLWHAANAVLARPWVCLAMILTAGGLLRLEALSARYPDGIMLAGSALEYRAMAEHMLQPGVVGPPGNPMGMPLLLAPLFALLPWSHDAIQVGFTTGCGLLMALLAYLLGSRWVGAARGALVAALIAVNPAIITNSVTGATEEVFAVWLLLLLLLRERPSDATGGDLAHYLLIGAVAAGLVLIRKDGVLLLAPLTLGILLSEYRRVGPIHALCLAAPVLVLPLLALAGAGHYQELAGIKSSYWRGARAYYWFDFFRGRLPWEYRFYARLNLMEWWFGMHSLGEMLNIALRSTGRTVLGIGEAIWGQGVLILALSGAVIHWRQHRDLVLQLAIPLCLVPQLLWIYYSSNADAFRYIVRIIPLVLILAAVAEVRLAAWLQSATGRGGHTIRRILIRPGVLLGGLSILGLLAPWSAYQAALPQLSCPQAEQDHRLGGQIYQGLGELWAEFAAGRLAPEAAQEQLASLQLEHPRYAVTRYAQGLVAMHLGDLATARRHFGAAVESVPKFAEAAAWLAEVEILSGDSGLASRLLERATQERPDYPLLFLLRGQLHLLAGEHAAAAGAYRHYLETNTVRRREALERAWRLLARRGMTADAERVTQELERLDKGDAYLVEDQLVDDLLWGYLSYDLQRISLPMPFDGYVALNLGLAELANRQPEAARRALEAGTRVMAESGVCWSSLAWAYRDAGDLERAAAVLDQGLRRCPDSVLLRTNLAWVRCRQGRWDEAAVLCNAAAAEIDRGDPVPGRASELLRAGERQQAADLLERSWTPSAPVLVLPLTRAVQSATGLN